MISTRHDVGDTPVSKVVMASALRSLERHEQLGLAQHVVDSMHKLVIDTAPGRSST